MKPLLVAIGFILALLGCKTDNKVAFPEGLQAYSVADSLPFNPEWLEADSLSSFFLFYPVWLFDSLTSCLPLNFSEYRG